MKTLGKKLQKLINPSSGKPSIS